LARGNWNRPTDDVDPSTREAGSGLRVRPNFEGPKSRGALLENRVYKTAKAAGAGTTDRVPDEWFFSKERVKMLFESQPS